MNDWINVDECLPAEDEDVLCSDGAGIFIASQHNSFFTDEFQDLLDVTHWQHLPLPPSN